MPKGVYHRTEKTLESVRENGRKGIEANRGRKQPVDEVARRTTSLNKPEVLVKLAAAGQLGGKYVRTPEMRAATSAAKQGVWTGDKNPMHQPGVADKLKGPRSRGLTRSELQVAEEYEANGYTLYRSGWPDYLFIKGDEVIFVEVKSLDRSHYHLSDKQKKLRKVLERFAEYRVERR